jgi:hypothetical protein
LPLRQSTMLAPCVQTASSSGISRTCCVAQYHGSTALPARWHPARQQQLLQSAGIASRQPWPSCSRSAHAGTANRDISAHAAAADVAVEEYQADNFYEILGVSPLAAPKDIKRAYYTMVCHSLASNRSNVADLPFSSSSMMQHVRVCRKLHAWVGRTAGYTGAVYSTSGAAHRYCRPLLSAMDCTMPCTCYSLDSSVCALTACHHADERLPSRPVRRRREHRVLHAAK